MKITIYVTPYNEQVVTADGKYMSVRRTFVHGVGGFIDLWDWKPPSDLSKLSKVDIVLKGQFGLKKLSIPPELEDAIVQFLRNYHAKANLSFDCYSFVNSIKKVQSHRVPYMLQFWRISRLLWQPKIGSIVFLLSGRNEFHHAAIHVGYGLYLSVWGAGGDLAFATLRSMKRDYGASRAVLAEPRGVKKITGSPNRDESRTTAELEDNLRWNSLFQLFRLPW